MLVASRDTTSLFKNLLSKLYGNFSASINNTNHFFCHSNKHKYYTYIHIQYFIYLVLQFLLFHSLIIIKVYNQKSFWPILKNNFYMMDIKAKIKKIKHVQKLHRWSVRFFDGHETRWLIQRTQKYRVTSVLCPVDVNIFFLFSWRAAFTKRILLWKRIYIYKLLSSVIRYWNLYIFYTKN